MGRYQSDLVDSMLKDMGRVERANFAQCITLAKLCRLLQAEVGEVQNLSKKNIDHLDEVFRAAKRAVEYVSVQPYDSDIAKRNFIDAEGKLANFTIVTSPNRKAEVAALMRSAGERDATAQNRLKVASHQRSRSRANFHIEISISSTTMNEIEETKKLRASSDDSLDGLLFLLSPPGHHRDSITHLTYHPHFYAQPTQPSGRYNLLQPWTTIQSLPTPGALRLAHNKKKLPFLLLPQETRHSDKVDVLVTDLNSPLPFECRLEIRETGESMVNLEESWDKYPPQDVREFQELDWKLVIGSQPTPTPPPSPPLSPPTPPAEADVEPAPSEGSPKADDDSDTPLLSNMIIVSAVVVVVLVVAIRWWRSK